MTAIRHFALAAGLALTFAAGSSRADDPPFVFQELDPLPVTSASVVRVNINRPILGANSASDRGCGYQIWWYAETGARFGPIEGSVDRRNLVSVALPVTVTGTKVAQVRILVGVRDPGQRVSCSGVLAQGQVFDILSRLTTPTTSAIAF